LKRKILRQNTVSNSFGEIQLIFIGTGTIVSKLGDDWARAWKLFYWVKEGILR
jgi:hypothetical protein